MNKKYFNEAIIGNKNIVVSFNEKGKLLRLLYPTRDFKQFVDNMLFGVKVNDSKIIYLHEDINNIYNQYYTEKTNILNTEIENTYFKLKIKQTDFVLINKDVIVKKYIIKNDNVIDLDINFLVYSELLSNSNNMVGSKIEKGILTQYTHDFEFNIFANSNIDVNGHRLNNSKEDICQGVIYDKDYIGMSKDSAVSYGIGVLKPGESKEINIYITINNKKRENEIEQIKKLDIEKEEKKLKNYWNNYVKEHDGLEILKQKDNKIEKIFDKEIYEKIKQIYIRTILLYPLLTNNKTGGISAAIEVDEERNYSGRYSYCWPRDAVFITKALDILKMYNETEMFYKNFCKKTQSKNGMWEQRFYTDGNLAPCWGYQIDETASVVFGIYRHYIDTNSIEFLEDTYEMCSKAIEFLKKYIDFITESDKQYNNEYIFEKNESYDLWEMNEGIHLYSLSSIYAAFNAYNKINNVLNKKNKNVQQYVQKVKKYSYENYINKNSKILKRNNKDEKVDISVIGSIVPFEMFNVEDIKNTIEKIDMTLRTYTGGYIRFEEDTYMGGNNPWPIATLWMALYNLQIGKINVVKEQIEFIAKTANEHGFLSEQIDNEKMCPKWVVGLGWSHAMFIDVINKIKDT